MGNANARFARRVGCLLPGARDVDDESGSQLRFLGKDLVAAIAVSADRRRADEDGRTRIEQGRRPGKEAVVVVRDSRISRCRASVQRCPMFSPLRLTIASVPSTREAASSPAAGFQTNLVRAGGLAANEPHHVVSVRPKRRQECRADEPDAPLMTTLTTGSGTWQPMAGCLRLWSDRGASPPRLVCATACAPHFRSPRARSSSASPTVLADATGFGRVAAILMSATTFAGASQFASISVLDAGGGGRGGSRSHLPERAVRGHQPHRRVDLSGGRLRRLIESQAIVDESWALSGRRGRFGWPILVGAGVLL